MNLHELREALDDLAGPEERASDALTASVERRVAKERARRRWVCVSVVTAMVVGVVALGSMLRSDDSGLRVQAPSSRSTGASSSPNAVPTVSIYLPNRLLPSGTTLQTTVVVQNRTGHAITIGACDTLFQAELGNGSIQQQPLWLDCLRQFTIPVGRSTFPIVIYTNYSSCSADGQGTPTACSSSGQPPPLPDGTYTLRIVATAGLHVRLPPPTTVHVSSIECASSGPATVKVPDVAGWPLATAIRIARAAGLNVVGFGVAKTDPVDPARECSPPSHPAAKR